jgi:ATP-dependent Clp protease ATP-binding subunit ClpC
MNTDGILKRRLALETFSKIIVEPTSVEETITILNNIKNKYRPSYYLLTETEACVKPDRYMSERFYRQGY